MTSTKRGEVILILHSDGWGNIKMV